MLNVGILDYSAGNLTSVCNACYYLGFNPIVINSPSIKYHFDRLIIPGVGSASSAISYLRETGLYDYVLEVKARNIPIIGICLGFQLLFSTLYEGGISKGFSLFEGEVKSMSTIFTNYQLPRTGWCSVTPSNSLTLPPREFYFLHSFYVAAASEQFTYSETSSLDSFSYLAACSNHAELVSGFQYHPEKSSLNGLLKLEMVLKDGFLSSV